MRDVTHAFTNASIFISFLQVRHHEIQQVNPQPSYNQPDASRQQIYSLQFPRPILELFYVCICHPNSAHSCSRTSLRNARVICVYRCCGLNIKHALVLVDNVVRIWLVGEFEFRVSKVLVAFAAHNNGAIGRGVRASFLDLDAKEADDVGAAGAAPSVQVAPLRGPGDAVGVFGFGPFQVKLDVAAVPARNLGHVEHVFLRVLLRTKTRTIFFFLWTGEVV